MVELYANNVKIAGADVGTSLTMVAVHLTPEAVFRFELGRSKSEGDPVRTLAPREIAFAIAYALGDRAPDEVLLKAADSGKLASPDDVAREVNRLFADAKFGKPRLLRFFREYFG